MLFVGRKNVINIKVLLKAVTYSIKTTVTGSFDDVFFAAMKDGDLCKDSFALLEVTFNDLEYACALDILKLELVANTLWCKLCVFSV